MAGKRKTAQQSVTKKAEPASKRRYLIIEKVTGEPTIGCSNAYCDGISIKERAERQSESLLIDTEVVLHHEFYGLPDPDEETP